MLIALPAHIALYPCFEMSGQHNDHTDGGSSDAPTQNSPSIVGSAYGELNSAFSLSDTAIHTWKTCVQKLSQTLISLDESARRWRIYRIGATFITSLRAELNNEGSTEWEDFTDIHTPVEHVDQKMVRDEANAQMTVQGAITTLEQMSQEPTQQPDGRESAETDSSS